MDSNRTLQGDQISKEGHDLLQAATEECIANFSVELRKLVKGYGLPVMTGPDEPVKQKRRLEPPVPEPRQLPFLMPQRPHPSGLDSQFLAYPNLHPRTNPSLSPAHNAVPPNLAAAMSNPMMSYMPSGMPPGIPNPMSPFYTPMIPQFVPTMIDPKVQGVLQQHYMNFLHVNNPQIYEAVLQQRSALNQDYLNPNHFPNMYTNTNNIGYGLPGTQGNNEATEPYSQYTGHNMSANLETDSNALTESIENFENNIEILKMNASESIVGLTINKSNDGEDKDDNGDEGDDAKGSTISIEINYEKSEKTMYDESVNAADDMITANQAIEISCNQELKGDRSLSLSDAQEHVHEHSTELEISPSETSLKISSNLKYQQEDYSKESEGPATERKAQQHFLV